MYKKSQNINLIMYTSIKMNKMVLHINDRTLIYLSRISQINLPHRDIKI